MRTSHSAYASFEEPIKGSINEGKFADLVILDRNSCTVEPAERYALRVEMTLIDGRVVYDLAV